MQQLTSITVLTHKLWQCPLGFNPQWPCSTIQRTQSTHCQYSSASHRYSFGFELVLYNELIELLLCSFSGHIVLLEYATSSGCGLGLKQCYGWSVRILKNGSLHIFSKSWEQFLVILKKGSIILFNNIFSRTLVLFISHGLCIDKRCNFLFNHILQHWKPDFAAEEATSCLKYFECICE